jgi:hypothetical protein
MMGGMAMAKRIQERFQLAAWWHTLQYGDAGMTISAAQS